jgi:excisionase family DNA binding protein
MQDKEVLTVKEAAEFLGLKPFTMRMYARNGTVPASRLGGQWRFIKSDLLDCLRSKSSRPLADKAV